jgi:hypothetical protein
MATLLDEAGNDILDEALGQIYDEAGMPAASSEFSVTCECLVYVGLSITATMECEVGVPYRIQPTDRWQQMYPS